jgi:hypothetical protein
MRLRKIGRSRTLRLLVAAVFLVGAFGNLAGHETIVEDYARWGYPSWFRFVTGALEVATTILLLSKRNKGFGILLGGAIMVAALGTLLLHGELPHALAPAGVIVALSMIAVA